MVACCPDCPDREFCMQGGPCGVAREAYRRVLLTRLRAAYDPGVLDCGRVGLPCVAVVPVDRWCSCCRIRQAIDDLEAAL